MSDATYTLRSLREMLGMSAAAITRLIDAGFVKPARGPRNEYRFTFQDVVLLRTAQALQAAEIPTRRVMSSLRKLQERLPAELPLSGLRIRAIGSDVVVRDASMQWAAADTGQLLIDFEVTPAGGSVSVLNRREAVALGGGPKPPAHAPRLDAAGWFARGEQLEADDRAGAEAAYRAALAAAPDHAAAALNLGAMLCEQGRCDEALALLDAAIERRPDQPLLHYNRAIALEDLQRPDDAIDSYEASLALAPSLADAHFNAARLCVQRGDSQRALRHYSAYRRATPPTERG